MATSPPPPPPTTPKMKTRILKVPPGTDSSLGHWATPSDLTTWQLPSETLSPLQEAATRLQTSPIPVAFPTETVYGLGADATRSSAVKGIYTAKGRPSDNPLIVHVSDLSMLAEYLPNGQLPPIYSELIQKFWPGPLTILLPNSVDSKLAPEVTAGLSTFGVRMPNSALARTLIKMVGKPLAAPSANASTRPSPTKAEHVLEDLDGRIEIILDGGDCAVGVESTVVDGLCDPPVVLRPGGVGIEELRACKGWEAVVKGYKDQSEVGDKSKPRAPGMKYKHYSPRARVVLYESRQERASGVAQEDLEHALLHEKEGGGEKTVAVIRTVRWPVAGGLGSSGLGEGVVGNGKDSLDVKEGLLLGSDGQRTAKLLELNLGQDVKAVAHGLFAALRELDRLGADVIFVEGVSDGDDIAAAVMNRLRKAASEIRA